jgi:hypothetical protein
LRLLLVILLAACTITMWPQQRRSSSYTKTALTRTHDAAWLPQVMKSNNNGYPECDCYTAEMLLVAMNANLADVQATYGTRDTTGTTDLPVDW